MRYNKAAVVYSRTGLKVIATHKKKMQTKTTLMLNSWFSEDEPHSLSFLLSSISLTFVVLKKCSDTCQMVWCRFIYFLLHGVSIFTRVHRFHISCLHFHPSIFFCLLESVSRGCWSLSLLPQRERRGTS